MPIPVPQNFYKETVAVAWTTGAGNFYVSTKPTVSEGYLVISANNPSLREIVKFTAVGTDGTGDYVTVTAANRGLGGTTEQTHEVGESVYMNVTAQNIQELSDELDNLREEIAEVVAAGAAYSDENIVGITRLSKTPSESLGTVAITIASPAVLTLASHGLIAGDRIKITTDGFLPTGLTADTNYYVISTGLTTDTFQIATTIGGTAIDTSGSQSGTHTLLKTTPTAVEKTDTDILPTSDEKAALGGASNTPDADNKFVTEDDLSDPEFKAPQVVVFTSSGTWTKDAGLKYVIVEGVGGGGGAHTDPGSRDPGGGGGYFRKLIAASALGATETVTVGAAGTSASTSGGTTDGGATSFGSHATANGGGRNAGAGGTATGGDINIQGGDGKSEGGGTASNDGAGGSSFFGFTTKGAVNPRGYGAGGSEIGGATAGILIVTEYYM